MINHQKRPLKRNMSPCFHDGTGTLRTDLLLLIRQLPLKALAIAASNRLGKCEVAEISTCARQGPS